MEMNKFIENFADQFDEIDVDALTPELLHPLLNVHLIQFENAAETSGNISLIQQLRSGINLSLFSGFQRSLLLGFFLFLHKLNNFLGGNIHRFRRCGNRKRHGFLIF